MAEYRNMKILYLLPDASTGGTEIQTVELAKEMKRRGHTPIFVFLTGGGMLEKDLAEANIEFQNLNRKGKNPILSGFLFTCLKLSKLIRAGNFSILHAQLGKPIIYAHLARVLSGKSCPQISGIRGELPIKSFLVRILFRKIINKSDYLVFNSTWICEKYKKIFGLHPGKYSIIRNGVKSHYLEMHERNFRRKKYISFITVSNLWPYKNVKTLLLGFASAKIPNSQLTICGSGPEDSKLRALAIDLGISSSVRFTGRIPDVHSKLLEADIAIHPSLTEGMSNAILEEMACGLPIIASHIPSNLEILTPERNALFYPPMDYLALAERMRTLVGDESLREKMTSNNLSDVQTYSWTNCANAYEKVYSEMLL
jgi:glycosyltransferase involved in cell wall biosynthesis